MSTWYPTNDYNHHPPEADRLTTPSSLGDLYPPPYPPSAQYPLHFLVARVGTLWYLFAILAIRRSRKECALFNTRAKFSSGLNDLSCSWTCINYMHIYVVSMLTEWTRIPYVNSSRQCYNYASIMQWLMTTNGRHGQKDKQIYTNRNKITTHYYDNRKGSTLWLTLLKSHLIL